MSKLQQTKMLLEIDQMEKSRIKINIHNEELQDEKNEMKKKHNLCEN